MELTGRQFQQLHAALLDAYPNYFDLKMMLKFQLDLDLATITSEKGQAEVVFALIEQVKKTGRLEELIDKAYEYNEGNTKLRSFVEGLNFSSPAQSPSSPNVALASSKYQISIENAQGITIGDGARVINNYTSSPTGSAPISRPQSDQLNSTQRCIDLTESIRETQLLIKQYEDQRRLADDPKAKRRAEQEIVDLRQQLLAYEAEARQLGCQ